MARRAKKRAEDPDAKSQIQNGGGLQRFFGYFSNETVTPGEIVEIALRIIIALLAYHYLAKYF